MPVRRYDVGELQKPKKLDNGWLRVDAHLSRVGIFEYRRHDGSVIRELRTPEEVFHEDALDSFRLVPLTLEHPEVVLDAENTRKYAMGAVGENVRRDGHRLAAPLLITDSKLVSQVLKGDRREISCGYTCDVEETPGEYQGERYDAVQRNIRGNHVAIVKRGRAGPEVCIRMDAQDAADTHHEAPVGEEKADSQAKETPMPKIRIDGVEFECPEQLAQVIARNDDKHADALAALKEVADKGTQAVETLKAKLDAAKEELEREKKARADAEDPRKMRAVVGARLDLEARAKKVLGSKAEKLDSLSDKELKLTILDKVSPAFKADGKSDAYVDARFDLEMEKLDAAESDTVDELSEARKATAAPRADSREEDTSAAARERMLKRRQDAWKQPVGTSKQ